jgi:hypothetical protein
MSVVSVASARRTQHHIPLFEAVSARICAAPTLAHFTPQSLANISHAFSLLQREGAAAVSSSTKSVLTRIADEAQTRVLSTFQTFELSQLLLALAHGGVAHRTLFAAAATYLSAPTTDWKRFDDQALANMARAFSLLGFSHPAFVQRMTTDALRRSASMNPTDLGMTALGLAQLYGGNAASSAVPEPVIKFVSLAVQRFMQAPNDYDDRQLSNLGLAVAVLQPAAGADAVLSLPPSFLKTFADRVAALHSAGRLGQSAVTSLWQMKLALPALSLSAAVLRECQMTFAGSAFASASSSSADAVELMCKVLKQHGTAQAKKSFVCVKTSFAIDVALPELHTAIEMDDASRLVEDLVSCSYVACLLFLPIIR